MPKTDKTEAKTPGTGFPGEPGYVATMEEKFLTLVTDPEVSDPAIIAKDIAQRILDADDFDAALDMGEATAYSAEDIGDAKFQIRSPITWLKSGAQYKQGPGVFVVITATMEDGSTKVLTCGGLNVLSQLYKGVTEGKVPSDERWFSFRAVGTSQGFETLYLARA